MAKKPKRSYIWKL